MFVDDWFGCGRKYRRLVLGAKSAMLRGKKKYLGKRSFWLLDDLDNI